MFACLRSGKDGMPDLPSLKDLNVVFAYSRAICNTPSLGISAKWTAQFSTSKPGVFMSIRTHCHRLTKIIVLSLLNGFTCPHVRSCINADVWSSLGGIGTFLSFLYSKSLGVSIPLGTWYTSKGFCVGAFCGNETGNVWRSWSVPTRGGSPWSHPG